eukprot:NODE_145_length_15762_cov_0.655238.p4 type:complete len:708 gc:universal NODE_145_length_15762_cov_0.655238:12638-14761(+)
MILIYFCFAQLITTKVDFIQHYEKEELPTYEIKIFYPAGKTISNISSHEVDHIHHFDEVVPLPTSLVTNMYGRVTIIIPVKEFKGIHLNFTADGKEYTIFPGLVLADKIQKSNMFNQSMNQMLKSVFQPLLKMNTHNITSNQIYHPRMSSEHLQMSQNGVLYDENHVVHFKRDLNVTSKLAAVGLNTKRAIKTLVQVLKTVGVFLLHFFQGIMSLRDWSSVLSTQKLINRYHMGTVPIMKKGTMAMKSKFNGLVKNWRMNNSLSFLNQAEKYPTNQKVLNITKKWENRPVGSMTLEDLTVHHVTNITVTGGPASLLREHGLLLDKVSNRLLQLATPDVVSQVNDLKLEKDATSKDKMFFYLLRSTYKLKDLALSLLQSSSLIVFDIVEPIMDFMQRLITIEVPGLSRFFKSISDGPLDIMNLLTLCTAAFMNFNLYVYTGQTYILSEREMDVLTSDPNPMLWPYNFYKHPKTGPFTKEKELKLNQLLDWMPRCQMLYFQYVGILYADLQTLTGSPKLDIFSWLDMLVFAMNYMYLVPYYPVDFVTDPKDVELKIQNPDKYWFTWYLHWFIEVIAGQLQTMHSFYHLTLGSAIKNTYDKTRFLIRGIIVGLPQMVVITWISANVWKNCDPNDQDRLSITIINTLAWSVDTASYLYMLVFAKHINDQSHKLMNMVRVDFMGAYIDITMLSLYHARLGLMMQSGKFGLID